MNKDNKENNNSNVRLDMNGNPLPAMYQTTPEQEAAKKKKLIKIIAAVLVVLLIGGTILYTVFDIDYNTIANDMVREFKAEDFGLESTEAFDFTVYDREGNEVHLSDMEGKTVVMNFWATWCGPCKYELGSFQRMYDEVGDEIVFMMINVTDGTRDTVESCTAYVDEHGYTFPLYFDTELSAMSMYSTGSLPNTFFISADGHIAAYTMGIVQESNIKYGIGLAEKKALENAGSN